jgi:uncharacterized protein YecE (DUF72 family)
MKFGKLQQEDLSSIDFSLPPDSPLTLATIASIRKKSAPKIYAGCAKWGIPEWVGKLYPPKTPATKFLQSYVQQFNSIELNATHYKIYPPSTIAGWREKAAGHEFLFSPKVPQAISHYTDLVSADASRKTDEFLEGIVEFKQHLGPVFLQLPERFSPAARQNLYNYIDRFPGDIRLCVELRHEQWFANAQVMKEWLTVFKKAGAGAVITDTAGRRDCVHTELTAPVAFIRFVGNDLHPTDYSRVDQWMVRIKSWIDAGLKEVFFFMHQPDENNSPVMCEYVVKQFNKTCGANIPVPQFVTGQKK